MQYIRISSLKHKFSASNAIQKRVGSGLIIRQKLKSFHKSISVFRVSVVEPLILAFLGD